VKWVGLTVSICAVLALGLLFWWEGREIALNNAWLREHGLGDLVDDKADEV